MLIQYFLTLINEQYDTQHTGFTVFYIPLHMSIVAVKVYFEEPVSTWIVAKFSLNIPGLLVWSAFRLTHVFVYLLLDVNVTLDDNGAMSASLNRTSPPVLTDNGATFCRCDLAITSTNSYPAIAYSI